MDTSTSNALYMNRTNPRNNAGGSLNYLLRRYAQEYKEELKLMDEDCMEEEEDDENAPPFPPLMHSASHRRALSHSNHRQKRSVGGSSGGRSLNRSEEEGVS
jgi:hypothetical protein